MFTVHAVHSVPRIPPRNCPALFLSFETEPEFRQFVISIVPCTATAAIPPAYLAVSPVKITCPSNQQLLIVQVVRLPSASFAPFARPTSPPTWFAVLVRMALLYTVSISPRKSPAILPIYATASFPSSVRLLPVKAK